MTREGRENRIQKKRAALFKNNSVKSTTLLVVLQGNKEIQTQQTRLLVYPPYHC